MAEKPVDEWRPPPGTVLRVMSLDEYLKRQRLAADAAEPWPIPEVDDDG